jgi:protein-tyrosine phosphatase
MSRHIPLEGNFNLRDLGGHATSDGRVVKHGCVFRSDELHALTDADLDVIAELGVQVVFDLRNDEERKLRPSRLPAHVHIHERESAPTEGSPESIETLIERGELWEPDDDVFAGIYIDLVEHLAPELHRVLELALDAHERPLLFHCAAGKDRTGLTAALVLGLLGVTRETILDEYELTNEFYAPRRFASLEALGRKHGANLEHIRIICSARRNVMTKALDHIDAKWGGFAGYAVEHLGAPADIGERLRATLLTA